jgi:hypothetical protein
LLPRTLPVSSSGSGVDALTVLKEHLERSDKLKQDEQTEKREAKAAEAKALAEHQAIDEKAELLLRRLLSRDGSLGQVTGGDGDIRGG